MTETSKSVKTAVVGLGKMGISHLAIANATHGLDVVAVCDTSSLVGQMVEKYTGISYVRDFDALMALPELDAVIIATPTRAHDWMIAKALDRGLHVFCEKPLTLTPETSIRLAERGRVAGRVCQVGYHNRFVGTFSEVRRLLDLGAIGRVRHVMAEAYGPVVLKPVAKTWRSNAEEGGGCLYDYAAHPINLMNWYVGQPTECIGADLTKQYSSEVDDAVYANLRFANGISGQVSVNWSDETMRKMTTRLSIWGDGGRIVVDRQELQIYIGANGKVSEGYNEGWTLRYITDLTPNVGYYLRGEEYSAQMEAFAAAAGAPEFPAHYTNDFESGAQTDVTLDMIRTRSLTEPPLAISIDRRPHAPVKRSMVSRVLGR